jgi:hypothetical protein
MFAAQSRPFLQTRCRGDRDYSERREAASIAFSKLFNNSVASRAQPGAVGNSVARLKRENIGLVGCGVQGFGLPYFAHWGGYLVGVKQYLRAKKHNRTFALNWALVIKES